MDLRKNLRDVTPGRTYTGSDTAGVRLFWPAFHVSVAVPPGYSVTADMESGGFASADDSLAGWFNLHDADDWLVSNWIDEGYSQGDETLLPVEAVRSEPSGPWRRFGSPSYAGYKLQVDDVFRYGASAIFTGPVDRADELSAVARQYVQSLRFVMLEPLNQDQATQALVAYLNIGVEQGHQLLQYIGLHFYLLRDEVMHTMRTLAQQAAQERNPNAEWIEARSHVLQQARQLVDEGKWDALLARTG